MQIPLFTELAQYAQAYSAHGSHSARDTSKQRVTEDVVYRSVLRLKATQLFVFQEFAELSMTRDLFHTCSMVIMIIPECPWVG